MTIVSWVIECDGCGREIDATEESFTEKDGVQLCKECSNSEIPIFNTYVITWTGILKGTSKVHARNKKEAERKAENSEVTTNGEEPKWHISDIEKE